MIANPPPPEVEPVLKWIRSQVPRPETLPKSPFKMPPLDRLRWLVGRRMCCPLGLIPSANIGAPHSQSDFDSGCCPLSDDEILDFWVWWDSQRDRVAAVDFVWPPKDNDGS